MKKILLLLLLLTSAAVADTDKIKQLEQRIANLESNKLSIPKGVFITGEVEAYYDDRTYDSGLDSRAELQVGINHKFNNPIARKSHRKVEPVTESVIVDISKKSKKLQLKNNINKE